jgi:hypothetical protein
MRQLIRMTGRKRDTRTILKLIEQSEERSPLFWWMVKHHDEMVATSNGKRIRWAPFCEKAAGLGLVDTRGSPPTERNARETWLQARKAVATARERAAANPPRPTPPSRFPKGWTPPIVSSLEIPVPAYLRPPGTAAVPAPSNPPTLPAKPMGPAGQEVASPNGPRRGSMDAAMEKLSEGDWWLGDRRRKSGSAES